MARSCAGFMLVSHMNCHKLYLQDDRACQDDDMQTLQSEDDRESVDDEEKRAAKRNKLTEQVEAVGAQVIQLQVRQTKKVKQQSCVCRKQAHQKGRK